MNIVRSLERRLEKLLEGVAGKVFSGRIHPSELAGKLAREADFARFQHSTGPATANLYVIQVNPRDLSVETSKLERMLAAEMTAYTSEEGLRLEGPIRVEIKAHPAAISGRADVHVEVSPGPPVVWAHLRGNGGSIDVGRNRATLGRAPDSDVVIAHDDISRYHALIYREKGQSWIQDLGSANGTTVDGQQVGREPIQIRTGSMIGLSDHRFRFVET